LRPEEDQALPSAQDAGQIAWIEFWCHFFSSKPLTSSARLNARIAGDSARRSGSRKLTGGSPPD